MRLEQFAFVLGSQNRRPVNVIGQDWEVLAIGVEKEFGSSLLLGDDCLFLFRLSQHSLFQPNSFNSTLVSCKSFVSKLSGTRGDGNVHCWCFLCVYFVLAA